MIRVCHGERQRRPLITYATQDEEHGVKVASATAREACVGLCKNGTEVGAECGMIVSMERYLVPLMPAAAAPGRRMEGLTGMMEVQQKPEKRARPTRSPCLGHLLGHSQVIYRARSTHEVSCFSPPATGPQVPFRELWLVWRYEGHRLGELASLGIVQGTRRIGGFLRNVGGEEVLVIGEPAKMARRCT